MTSWADHVETHTGTVFFFGDVAVKVRKPVRFSFVDLSTPALRRRAAVQEVRLNRRLAPDVYQGVADISLPDGRHEAAVVMRRLPAARRLATLVVDNKERLEDVVEEIARELAAFHARCKVRLDVGDPEHWQVLWNDNRTVLSTAPELVPPDALEALHVDATDYVAGCAPLFAARAEAGRVRDGHGDLLADDIFVLDDGVRILDCLDFDERLRCGDVLLDVAMLAMDLERLGAQPLARLLLDRYEQFAGDDPAPSLEHFFLGYRATVRAKVACLRWQQGDAASADQVRRLFCLARRHLRDARPFIVVVGGLPGSGKSTVARELSARRGWSMLSTDVVRRETCPDRGDRYTTAARSAVYDEVLARADAAVALGGSVVLDATWEREAWRVRVRDLAARRRAVLVELRCEVPEQEAARRLSRREGDASEADASVRATLAASFEPWPESVVVADAYEALATVTKP